MVLASIVTSKVIVATFVVVAVTSARRNPGVVFSGALINMPLSMGETPVPGSVKVIPFKVVVPAT